mmetsp:Transcript_57386/g.134568  ORF Transcript_57386/g.134568 Transcript_57386/m.134568 type:complete len:1037 (+) Transcript_57386:101-3211(+)
MAGIEVSVIDVEGTELGSPQRGGTPASTHHRPPSSCSSDPHLTLRPNRAAEGWFAAEGSVFSPQRSAVFSVEATQSMPDLHSAAEHPRSSGLLPPDQSRPSTSASAFRPSTSGSTCGSGRFSPEEMVCFRRVPRPASQQESYEDKVDNYWAAHGGVRRGLMESNWHTLPVLKGQFYNHPKLSEHLLRSVAKARRLRRPVQTKEDKKPEVLPEEHLTAAVLEEIYPRVGLLRKDVGEDEADLPAVNQGPGADRRTSKRSAKRASATAFVNPAEVAAHLRVPMGAPNTASSSASGVAPSVGQTIAAGGANAAAKDKGNEKDHGGATNSNLSNVMMEFRKRFLEKFSTTKEAFETLAHEFPMEKELSKKELRRVLQRQGVDSTREERDAVFDALDVDKNGHLSMAQFHIAIEAAAPVRTVGDLRRRWLACGYSSMASAVSAMDEAGMGRTRRLTLKEFGEALSRVSVPDVLEHAAIFNIVLDPHDKHGRVSIAELASAVASVSPSLDLEELRDRVVRRYGGAMERAYGDLDPKHRGDMDRHTFVGGLTRRLGYTEADANKIFRKIDIDGNGDVSREEFATALELSDPSLFHEDLRLRIRQRFRSIQETFKEAFSETTGEDMDQIPALTLERFQELLLPLGLTENEISKLFNLVDLDGDGTLTVKEFLKGIKFFAPSCVLEDLRMHCLQRAPYITDVFKEVDRTQQLDRFGFIEVLSELDLLAGVQVDTIFDLLDVKNDGHVSIGMLIAALKSGGPGSRLRLPDDERNDRARVEVLGFTSTASRLCNQLKNTVRQGAAGGDDHIEHHEHKSTLDEPAVQQSLATQPSAASSFRAERSESRSKLNKNGARPTGREITLSIAAQNFERRQEKAIDKPTATEQQGSGGGTGGAAGSSKPSVAVQQDNLESTVAKVAEATLAGAAPRLRTVPSEEISKYVFRFARNGAEGLAQTAPTTGKEKTAAAPQERVQGAQQSWNDVWMHLNRHPDKKRRLALVKNLHGYFQQAASSLSHDVTLLQSVPSRFANQQRVRAHEAALEVKPR